MNQNITEESLKRFFKEIYSDADKHQLECLIYPVLQVLYSKPDTKEWVKRDEIIKNIQENYPEIKWGRTGLALDQPFSMKFKGASEEAKFLNQLFEFQADDRPGAIKTAYKLRSENIIAIKAFLENNPIQSEQVISLLKARVTFLNSEKNSDVSGKNAPEIWKISHGKKDNISDEDNSWLNENYYVAIGYTQDHNQRKKFNQMKQGDYFYLVRDKNIIRLAQVDDKEPKNTPDSFSNKGWVMRKYKPIEVLNDGFPSTKVKGKKGWMPQNASSVNPIPEKELKEFESQILIPAFGLNLSDLNNNKFNLKKTHDMGKVTNQSLNRILYGPPGTGKTYNTVTESLKILEYPDAPKGLYEEQKKRFDSFKQKGRIEFVTFHQSFSYEDFVEGIRAETTKIGRLKYSIKSGVFKVIAEEAKKNTHQPYVLIIDEINRGNTSKIFGELITLIEDTKRYGKDEAIEVTLPYSGEQFSVPNNLYIIGTMNTADRSLALIDTALRRRFDFIEMMPDPELILDKDKNNPLVIDVVEIQKMLKAINNRIEALYDREHTIGHAFFMQLNENPNIEDLGRVFKNKILPLLEEYFFEDWEKICLVLGGAKIYKPKDFKNIGFESISKCYERVEEALNKPETYLAIYNDSAVSTNAETNDQ